MTKRQFEKRMRDIMADARADGKDMGDIAIDLADCALYDPEIRKYVERVFNQKDRMIQREILADYLVG